MLPPPDEGLDNAVMSFGGSAKVLFHVDSFFSSSCFFNFQDSSFVELSAIEVEVTVK